MVNQAVRLEASSKRLYPASKGGERRTRHDLNTAVAREHILEGLMIAVDALMKP